MVVTSPEPSVPDVGQHPELSVHQPSPKVCVITVACEVDMVTTPAFGQLLSQELAAGHPVLLVDLGGCEFMGSSGLAALMAARDQASQTGTQLALTGLTRNAPWPPPAWNRSSSSTPTSRPRSARRRRLTGRPSAPAIRNRSPALTRTGTVLGEPALAPRLAPLRVEATSTGTRRPDR